MAQGKYERELKSILSSDEETIDEVTKTCTEEEKEGYYQVKDIPFMVVRGAGSLGVDLVAVRGDVSFLIEVKSSKKDVLYLSDQKRLTEQAEKIIEICTKTKLLPIYAYRLKGQRGDKWRVFTLEIEGLSKKYRILNRKLPNVKKTVHDNYKIPWEEGMPLSDFLSYLDRLLG
ncbi:MAG: Holliday junction resolvase [Candidatus Thermoplasmatota archaeon]|nr:Holliday junction resolvase [Candidatus Thermoplasmatota archaeon]